jgi:hypothetical protein
MMSVQLLAIKFNHDSNSATNDALNIRRNATQFVSVPEWQRGLSINPEDSPAAYAIAQTQGHTITIQAKFKRTDNAIQTAEIRAVDPAVEPQSPGGCIAFLLWLIRSILRALFGNVLGDVKAKQVTFLASGETGFETFDLQHLRLWNAGVGVRTTTWRWQYRLQPGDPWTDFETTNHRIYSVLDVPKLPWQQTPYNSGNTQLPWTEVMDYACSWAILTGNIDDAASGVTVLMAARQIMPGEISTAPLFSNACAAASALVITSTALIVRPSPPLSPTFWAAISGNRRWATVLLSIRFSVSAQTHGNRPARLIIRRFGRAAFRITRWLGRTHAQPTIRYSTPALRWTPMPIRLSRRR